MLDLNKQSQIPNPKLQIENLRILLWDIDGTLMHSTRTGAYKEYFIPTLEKVYGTAGNLPKMQVSGMTDTQIAYESLREEGFEVSDIFAKVDKFIEVLGLEMKRAISQFDNSYGVFSGVREVLNETAANPVFVNSLLTGNLSTVAEAKLRYVDLWHYFAGKPHAFGEISHQRSELSKFPNRIKPRTIYYHRGYAKRHRLCADFWGKGDCRCHRTKPFGQRVGSI
jgi:hypothetical protein